ncbi:hypothetical protein BJF78_34830 [Pseudonocardia sp. CNS-139]|nr:hypothetical protein BJF78_34830 [Pseudonocardia sp. CNS-139]
MWLQNRPSTPSTDSRAQVFVPGEQVTSAGSWPGATECMCSSPSASPQERACCGTASPKQTPLAPDQQSESVSRFESTCVRNSPEHVLPPPSPLSLQNPAADACPERSRSPPTANAETLSEQVPRVSRPQRLSESALFLPDSEVAEASAA